jgi:imidazole glycerol-phosphate synthase subunit HisF
MRNLRLIARLDVKMDWLIKGVQLEGWRKVGDPAEFARRYASEGADELLFMDVVASLYERNNLHDIVQRVASEIFVPLTVGGGVRSIEDAAALLSGGADKIAINTAATRDPSIITALSDRFGAQATVVSIEAIKRGPRQWEAMTDNGRNRTGLDVLEWTCEVERRGAGEILLTSIDAEGTGQGYDYELVQAVSSLVNIPVVACGGLGETRHLADLIDRTEASAAAIAQALHWGKMSFADLRSTLADKDCFVRPLPADAA